MPRIYEAVISTVNADASVHIVPMGYRRTGDNVVLAPFRPSTTLDNLLREKRAAINLTDNVSVIAGALTGRFDWPTLPAERIPCRRLADTLAHLEVEVRRVQEDELRPRLHCEIVHEQLHAPFKGFNRAQAAVLEAAILVTRLHMLPPEKIDSEITYLSIAIEKTAGEQEQMAWDWLMQRIAEYRGRQEVPGQPR